MPRGKKKGNRTEDLNYKDVPLPAQLEGENDLYYQLFCNYCLLGTKRSLERVAEIYYKNLTATETTPQVKPTIHYLKDISRDNRWVERAKEYDILCLRFYQQTLLVRSRANWEDWVERGIQMDTAQSEIMREVCSQATEYVQLSQSRRKWLKNNAEQLAENPKLLSLAHQLENEGLDIAQRVLKISDELWNKQRMSKLDQIFNAIALNSDFIEGEELAATLTVEALKGSQVEEK